jgi:hypothetical protein
MNVVVARLTRRRLWRSKEGDDPGDGSCWAETPLGLGPTPERNGVGRKEWAKCFRTIFQIGIKALSSKSKVLSIFKSTLN